MTVCVLRPGYPPLFAEKHADSNGFSASFVSGPQIACLSVSADFTTGVDPNLSGSKLGFCPSMIQHPSSWFVSDLHLFSRRSSAPLLEATIRSAVQQSQLFVLGGDIFDFRWSTQANVDHAVQDSIEWLQRLMDVNTNCKFHYLLGNHDCHPAFVDSLDRLSQSVSQLSWHRHYLRLDDNVFLHGDIVDTRVPAGRDYHEVLDARRLLGELRKPPTRMSHTLYDMAVHARVHRLVVQVAKRPKIVLNRLSRYLAAHALDADSGIQHVFFGHTHRRLSAVAYRGIRYHNPGAAIKGLPFQLIKF